MAAGRGPLHRDPLPVTRSSGHIGDGRWHSWRHDPVPCSGGCARCDRSAVMETKACYALGRDIGGSSIKWALVSHSARDKPRVIETGIRPIKKSRMPEDVITELADIPRTTRHAHGALTSIGVGIPGMFEAATGIPTLLPNFPGAWVGYHLPPPGTRRLEQPIVPVNDAKAFSFAESVVGAAVDQSLVVCVVLGTGVGGGVVQNGALVTGKGS